MSRFPKRPARIWPNAAIAAITSRTSPASSTLRRNCRRKSLPRIAIWISLRAQLEEEGIIRTPADVIPVEPASWWQSINAFFSNRVLATAMVGILIAAAAVFQIRSDRTIRVVPPVQTATAQPVVPAAKTPVTKPTVAAPTVAELQSRNHPESLTARRAT